MYCKTRQETFDVLSTIDNFVPKDGALAKLDTIFTTSPNFIILSPNILLSAIYYRKHVLVNTILDSFTSEELNNNHNYWDRVIRIAISQNNIVVLVHLMKTHTYIHQNILRVAIECKSTTAIYIISREIHPIVSVDNYVVVAQFCLFSLAQILKNCSLSYTIYTETIHQLSTLELTDAITIFDKYSGFKSCDVLHKPTPPVEPEPPLNPSAYILSKSELLALISNPTIDISTIKDIIKQTQ